MSEQDYRFEELPPEPAHDAPGPAGLDEKSGLTIVQVSIEAAISESLPMVCMVCGERAVDRFYTQMPLRGPFSALTCYAPLCDAHKSYFRSRHIAILAGLGLAVLGLCLVGGGLWLVFSNEAVRRAVGSPSWFSAAPWFLAGVSFCRDFSCTVRACWRWMPPPTS
jgi:hypothetical protein